MITTKAFWLGAAERATKTFFQTMVSVITVMIGANTLGVSATVGQVDWLTALSTSVLATLLSIATSIGNARFVAGTEQATTTGQKDI